MAAFDILQSIQTFLSSMEASGFLADHTFSYNAGAKTIETSPYDFCKIFETFLKALQDLKGKIQQADITSVSPGMPGSQSRMPKPDLEAKQVQISVDQNEGKIQQAAITYVSPGVAESQSRMPKPDLDTKLVQIRVDKNEMNRRITAFISRKRKEIDEWNVQEFCSRTPMDEYAFDADEEYSCARVDAVFIPRSGSKSHLKVSKVVNQWGPQTKLMRPSQHRNLSFTSPTKMERESCANEIPRALDERLHNLESHLRLKPGRPVPSEVYSRLKQIEDRLLYLEGLSPDYFQVLGSSNSVRGRVAVKDEKMSKYSGWSLTDIENKIRTLRDELKKKTLSSDTSAT